MDIKGNVAIEVQKLSKHMVFLGHRWYVDPLENTFAANPNVHIVPMSISNIIINTPFGLSVDEKHKMQQSWMDIVHEEEVFILNEQRKIFDEWHNNSLKELV